jgi:serine/threonine protein kinase
VIKSFQREIDILSSIGQETLLSLRGYIGLNRDRPAIIKHHMSGRSLSRLLERKRKGDAASGWDDIQKLIVLYGISVGMLILQRSKILH